MFCSGLVIYFVSSVPSAIRYGTAAGIGLLYFTDFKEVLQYLPFYNGKFPTDEVVKKPEPEKSEEECECPGTEAPENEEKSESGKEEENEKTDCIEDPESSEKESNEKSE